LNNGREEKLLERIKEGDEGAIVKAKAFYNPLIYRTAHKDRNACFICNAPALVVQKGGQKDSRRGKA